MLDIKIPQSRKQIIQSHMAEYNQVLSKNNLGRLEVSFGKPFVSKWFITERVWDPVALMWVDKGVSRSVKLERLQLDLKFPEVSEGGLVGMIGVEAVEFDELLNQPTKCLGVGFNGVPLSSEFYARAFDENRTLRCEHCDKKRSRERVFVVNTSDGEVIYGSACLRHKKNVTIQKVVKWHAFLDEGYEALKAKITSDSRIITFPGGRESPASICVDSFINSVHDRILSEGRFMTTSMAMPTGKRSLSSCLKGQKYRQSPLLKDFGQWMQNLKVKNKFLKRCKEAYVHCLKSGVDMSSAALLSSIYAAFLKDIKFNHVELLSIGFYSGLLEVESHVVEQGVDCVYFRDKFGRRFKSFPVGGAKYSGMCLLTGNIDSVDYSDAHALYVMADLKVHKI